MSWIDAPRATFDLETTGVDVTTARIVTASLLLLNPDGSVQRAGEWLANPALRFPKAPHPCTVSQPNMRAPTGNLPSR